MYVSQTLKHAVKKVYIEAKKQKPQFDGYELMGFIVATLKIDPEDYYDFFKLLPRDVKRSVMTDTEQHRRTGDLHE